MHVLRLRVRRHASHGRRHDPQDHQGRERLRPRARMVQGARDRRSPVRARRRARGEHRGGDRGGGADPGQGALPGDLRPLRHHLRGAATGSGDRRHDRRQRGYHHVGVPWSVRHRVPGHRRKHGNPGRDPQPRRPAGVLGRQSRRVSPAPVHALRSDGQGDVRAERPEGPHRGAGGRAPHAERGGGGHLRAGEAAARFRGALGACVRW